MKTIEQQNHDASKSTLSDDDYYRNDEPDYDLNLLMERPSRSVPIRQPVSSERKFWIQPHFIIGDPLDPYLLRWYVTPWSDEESWFRKGRFKNFFRRLPNVYVHCMLRSDDDRALHDHPWANLSIILKGGYAEWLFTSQPVGGQPLPPTRYRLRKPWHFVLRKATLAHRLELHPQFVDCCETSHATQPLRPSWSLFMTWGKVREWGFWDQIRASSSTSAGAVNYTHHAHWIHNEKF